MSYLDLLHVPYLRGGTDPKVGLDCRGVALELLKRSGRETRPPTDSEEALCNWVTGGVDWELLGDDIARANEIGDIAFTASGDAPAGVLFLVGRSPQLFITSTPKRGVHTLRARAVRDIVLGVYRMKAA